MKLVFGFEDIPYSGRYSQQSPLPASIKKRRPRTLSAQQQGYGQGKTTGQIATELENKYRIVETFYTLEEDNIVKDYEEAIAESLENGMGKGNWDVTYDTTKIENKFKRNLTARRYDGLIKGVPTLAATRGVSHLRQNPYASRASRPSFVDTSLYQRSFKAWTEK